MLDKLQAADAKVQNAVVQTVGGQAPDATISPTASQVVQAALTKSVSTLTGGDVKLPVVEQPPGRLAPQAFTALMAFETMIDGLLDAGIEEARYYKIDAKKAATDDNALVEASHLISKAGKDKALQTAIRRSPAAKASGKTPPPAEKASPPSEPGNATAGGPAASQADELTNAIMARRK